MTKLRKGGDARYVITSLVQGDSFTIPHGFKARELISDTGATVTTTAPTITAGYTAPVNQTGTITVAGVVGNASTVFSIGAIASATQIAASNTVAQTVALIQSQFGPGGAQYGALLNAGWILTSFNTATGVVGFIGSPAKTSSAPAIVTTSLTTQTVVSAVVTNGSRSNDVLTSSSLATAVATATDHSANFVSGKNFTSANNTNNLSLAFATNASSTGNYVVCGVTSPSIASGQTPTQIVTTLQAMKIPGYTLTNTVATTLVITSVAAGAGTPTPTFYQLPSAPVTGTVATPTLTVADPVVYIGSDLNAVGNANIYVTLQKLN